MTSFPIHFNHKGAALLFSKSSWGGAEHLEIPQLHSTSPYQDAKPILTSAPAGKISQRCPIWQCYPDTLLKNDAAYEMCKKLVCTFLPVHLQHLSCYANLDNWYAGDYFLLIFLTHRYFNNIFKEEFTLILPYHWIAHPLMSFQDQYGAIVDICETLVQRAISLNVIEIEKGEQPEQINSSAT